jgi:hypothetical protein
VYSLVLSTVGYTDRYGFAVRLWVASDRIYAYPVDAGKFVTYEALKDFWRGRKGGAKLSTLETPAVGGALAGEKLPYSRNVTRTVRSPLAYGCKRK